MNRNAKEQQMIRIGLTLGALALVTLSGCGESTTVADGDGGDNGDSGRTTAGGLGDLAGRTFTSVTSTRDLVLGSSVVVTFAGDGTVSVNAGCNSMSGAASLDGDRLVVTGLAGTELGCAPALMDQDTWLAGLLTSRPVVTTSGDELRLSGGDDLVLRERVVEDAPLESTTWQLDTLLDGAGPDGTASSLPAGGRASLRLTDGRIEVESGCNTGVGPVEVRADTLRLGGVGWTEAGCAREAAAVERHMQAVLRGEVGFAVEGDRLTLTAPDGSGLGFTAR